MENVCSLCEHTELLTYGPCELGGDPRVTFADVVVQAIGIYNLTGGALYPFHATQIEIWRGLQVELFLEDVKTISETWNDIKNSCLLCQP